jgi:glycosyltransferase 2 family protein
MFNTAAFKSRHIFWIAKALITFALLVFLFISLDISIFSILVGLKSPLYFFGALLIAVILVPWVMASRWCFFLRIVEVKESTLSLWALYWKSMLFGLSIPGSQGVDFFRILFIEKRHPACRGVVGSTVLVERLIGLWILCLLALLALPFAYSGSQFLFVALTVVGFVMALGVVTLAFFKFGAVRQAPQNRVQNKWLAAGLGYLSKFFQAARSFPYSAKLFPAVLWIILFQISLISTVHLLFIAFGQPLPFLQNMLLYPLTALVALIPITITGLGLREGAFIYFYSLVGVPPEIALGVSLTIYFLLIVLPALFGGMLLVFDRVARPSVRT